VASLQIAFAPNNQATPVTRRTHDDLPAHVKGTVEWNRPNRGYYIPQHLTSNNALEPVEFINNRWYELRYDASARTFYTQENLAIPVQNIYGIGFWNVTDPQHPEYQPPSRAPSRTSFRFTPGAFDNSDSSEGSDTISAHSAVSIQSAHSPETENPTASIRSITSAFGPINIDTSTENPDVTMSANVTTVAPTHTPSSNGLKGTAPAVFNGDRSRSESFWNEFRRYRLLNRNNDSISIPFFRVLTALSYIKGPLVEDWVNACDIELEKRTDPTKPGSVRENDEVLWTEFETAFKAAWTDTAKVQSAYSQLMKLQMKELDIDTYNATFARLANAAGWEEDAKGTIDRYRSGLREAIQRRIINRDTMPDTMVEWQTAARKEVSKIKELQSSGLVGPRRNQTSRDGHSYQNTSQRAHSNSSNSQHVPMDVDAANATTPFKKLTDEERAQYRAEGRCFRCRTQGHMARNCPKNANAQNVSGQRNINAREASVTPPTNPVTPPTPPSTSSVPPPPPPKLSYAQQIRALEAKMSDEERSLYLDARDMGEDFCSAGL
jgi:hypothetical protein